MLVLTLVKRFHVDDDDNYDKYVGDQHNVDKHMDVTKTMMIIKNTKMMMMQLINIVVDADVDDEVIVIINIMQVLMIRATMMMDTKLVLWS